MIPTTLTKAGLLSAALVVAGCSGGGGGEPGRSPYGVYVAENIALRRSLESLPQVDAADLPASGTATYEGFAGFGVRMESSEQVGMFGTMDLRVDFAGAGDISGRIHDIASNGNVYSGEGAGPVSGELIIANGSIDRAPPDPRFSPHFRADLTGTLVDHVGPLEFDGRIDGRFRGDDLEMVNGGIAGRAGPTPLTSDRIAGSFTLAAQ